MLEMTPLAGVLRHVLERDGGASIGRTIVDEQEFEVVELLAKHAADRFAKEAFGIVKNADD